MAPLITYPKNKITIDEIQEILEIETYSDLVSEIKRLKEKGIISPIVNSKLNGKKPPLYNTYRIHKEGENNDGYAEELLYEIDPMLKTDYYLKNITMYKQDQRYILLLNDYIKNRSESFQEPASYNERSFEIWGREKFLLKEGGLRILKNLEVPISLLNVYHTTEPLSYYSHHKKTPQNILILENKDTFYSMRKHLLSGNQTICSMEIGTLIYGGGKSIYRSFQDFTVCAEPYLINPNNLIYYFGDLDYEGIIIYETLANQFQQQVEVQPFCLAYERMLTKAYGIGLPEMKENQNKNIGSLFYSYFNKNIQDEISEILTGGKYIPQEILQAKDF